MNVVIKKFGGTSVGDISRIKDVARLIQRYTIENPETRVVVVVSAMSGETNKLTALAKACVKEPDPRELDVLLSTGEQVTIALLAMALVDLGLPSKSLLATQARIRTDTVHNNAQITGIDSTQVAETLAKGMIPVVAGFQGIDADGNVTTLGRGGSDITAVALAASLKAQCCYIYTDVEGVYSTDPRVCRNARILKQVCHEEMLEMASLGAKVLHARSVYFAMRYNVPLVVMSTFHPGHGTWIVKEENLMEKPIVTGITYRTDEAKITVSKLPGGITSLNQIFDILAKESIFVDMITQTGFVDGKTNISFTVPDEHSSKALNHVQESIEELHAEGASLDRDIAKISVVGIGMRYNTGVAARMFSALASENIDVEMIATSEIKISVVIPRKYWEIAVRTLHDEFIEMEPETSVEV